MNRIIFFLLLTMLTKSGLAQEELSGYLKTHHYSFTLDSGFDTQTRDTLRNKLENYQLVLQAEGGSHYLDFYNRLTMVWFRFLNADLGLTHFFLEAGHSSAILVNKFLETGDTGYIKLRNNPFLGTLYEYNAGIEPKKKLHIFGVDFERPWSYVRGLKTILPGEIPPAEITPFIDQIREANDTIRNCDYILNINRQLKKALSQHEALFKAYLGNNFNDFEHIILNGKNCKDALNNRNGNMASNFLSFARETGDKIYYGELGEAHTILNYRNVGSLINKAPGFEGKVATVNVYCYKCTTAEEAVSNWPLRKIEKDILTYFLPYCAGGFTLFDLTGESAPISRYKAYGPFLIIAKEQH
jgi:hypothetical protein